jgi:glycyl-tRNA synthetase (class II)
MIVRPFSDPGLVVFSGEHVRIRQKVLSVWHDAVNGLPNPVWIEGPTLIPEEFPLGTSGLKRQSVRVCRTCGNTKRANCKFKSCCGNPTDEDFIAQTFRTEAGNKYYTIRAEACHSIFAAFPTMGVTSNDFPLTIAQAGRVMRKEFLCEPDPGRYTEFTQLDIEMFVLPECKEDFIYADRSLLVDSGAEAPESFRLTSLVRDGAMNSGMAMLANLAETLSTSLGVPKLTWERVGNDEKTINAFNTWDARVQIKGTNSEVEVFALNDRYGIDAGFFGFPAPTPHVLELSFALERLVDCLV